MSLLANSNAIETGGYNLQRSLRFRSSASAYLSRTPASAGNRTTWTWSSWVKRGKLGTTQTIYGATNTTTDANLIQFTSSDTLQFMLLVAGSFSLNLITAKVFRDPSAWYHIVVVYDSTQATASNRAKIYLNGTQITAFGTSTYPAQNTNGYINSTSYSNYISYDAYLDGYLAEVNFIDGQALTPSSFGSTDPITGVWQPKKYTGTYGTNGFYLPFSDNTSATTLAYDKSGNGNNWTPNNISTTAGVTYDSMTDVPTMAELSGNGNSNYAVLNPLDKGTGATTSYGNLRVVTTEASPNSQIRATMPILVKSYCEFTLTAKTSTGAAFGPAVVNMDITMATSDTLSGSYQIIWVSNGIVYNPASNSGYSTFAAGDILGVAYDPSTKTVWFAKNNVWITGNPSTGSGGFTSTDLTSFGSTQTFSWFDGTTGSAQTVDANFGQRPFAYTPPTGFVALNTFNLPTPTIKKGNQYMDATTYTGNGSTQSIVNAGGFQPDFVWMKKRSSAESHILQNSIAGTTKFLISNSTAAEDTSTAIIQSFDSSGFTLGASSVVNGSATTYVGWQWKAGGTAVTNTAGSITSQVSAGATQGFSVVTFTPPASGTSFTVGHGLGVTPKMMIVKIRNNGAVNWFVYHQAMGNTGYMALNLTNGNLGPYTPAWNNTDPTSSVATFGSYWIGSSYNMVAYCFAEIPGFSKFGSYTGNGSASAPPFVYTGFAPRFVLIKSATNGGYWDLLDSARTPNNSLFANVSDAEYGSQNNRFLSNGFSPVEVNNANGSGQTYIYMAFAETPFKFSGAR